MVTDELMADVAAVFGWPPSECDRMSVPELLHWRQLALARAGQDNVS